MLGLAFHPKFKNNGRFFVRYSAPRAGDPGEPCFGTSRGCHEEILAEYNVGDTKSSVADATSERILFRVDEPQFNHDAGNVAFGPDGLLCSPEGLLLKTGFWFRARCRVSIRVMDADGGAWMSSLQR